MKRHWFHFSAPSTFYGLAGRMTPWFLALALITGLISLYWGFFETPDRLGGSNPQKEYYRIIFVHVGSAWMSMWLYIVIAAWSAIGLVFNTRLSYMMAVSVAPTGAIFTFLALFTGAFWGKPSWGTWWDWDDGKIALEALFHEGRISATRRPTDFARLYDITERLIPAAVLARPAVPETEARKELLEQAAAHHGVGTLTDLCDYHRQNSNVCRPLVAELVEDGRLLEVDVEGWRRGAYLHPDAVVPRRVDARALLSPFDPVVFNRDRAERVFGFHYRVEIYVPKPKRRYGYYVLPFLLGDELVGRVDLKADRATCTLLVQAAWGEPDIDEAEVARELAGELTLLAAWLGLERVEVVGAGNLSRALGREVPVAPTGGPA